MSVRCITLVLDKSQHSGTDLLMLVVLADYSDDDGNSYPAVASLARKCRMSPRNANYILNTLQRSGELRVLKNEGPRGCNRYRIVLSALGAVTPLKPIAPLKAASPLQPTSSTPAAHFREPLKHTSPEPSLNRQRTVSSKSSVGADTSEMFARFYAAYPRKVGRPSAEKAFAKCKPTPELVTQMLAAISAQAKALNWTRDRLQYVPHPATWLNDQRWKDEVQTGAAAQSDRHPQWALAAGFANIDEAHNERCYAHNANEFRNGKRIPETTS